MYDAIDIPPNGDCFYLSVLWGAFTFYPHGYLAIEEAFGEAVSNEMFVAAPFGELSTDSMRAVRRVVYDHIQETISQDFWTAQLRRECETVLDDNEYASDLVIMALPQLLKMKLFIHLADEDATTITYGVLDDPVLTLHVQLHCMHYDLLYKITMKNLREVFDIVRIEEDQHTLYTAVLWGMRDVGGGDPEIPHRLIAKLRKKVAEVTGQTEQLDEESDSDQPYVLDALPRILGVCLHVYSPPNVVKRGNPLNPMIRLLHSPRKRLYYGLRRKLRCSGL